MGSVSANGADQTGLVQDQWMVAVGHGGCAGLNSVQGNLPDLPPWSDPQGFMEQLNRKGIRVSTVYGEYQKRPIVLVVAPDRGVNAVFLPQSLCRIMAQEELEGSSKKVRKK